MKWFSGCAFRRLTCGILAACYGILAVIATAPHLHDRLPITTAADQCLGAASVTIGPASARTPADQAGGGPCRLCGWGRSSARLSPLFAHRAATLATGEVRPDMVADVIEEPPSGTVLLRAPPVA